MTQVTVFTPTYNRAHLLGRVFEALAQQDDVSFEWLVIDDGSTDGTDALVRRLQEQARFCIRYESGPNRGKAACINRALDLARGEFFLVMDSDDWCTDDALARFVAAWDSLGDSRSEYCGVSALKMYTDGRIVGEDYRRLIASGGTTYVDRFNAHVKGDKWEMLRTSIAREWRYELASGERYQAPSYAWIGMGQHYRTLFINQPLGIVEYQADGISARNIVHRAGSPLSAVTYYRRAMTVASGRWARIRARLNLMRFQLHAGLRPELRHEAGVLALLAVAMHGMDRVRLRRLGATHK